MASTDPNLGLTYGWTLGESGWNTSMDANLKRLGAVVGLSVKDRDLTGRILEELRQVIHEMGEQGNYTVILEGNNTVVLYGAKAIDLTDTVIRTYNQKGTKISSKADSKTAAAN